MIDVRILIGCVIGSIVVVIVGLIVAPLIRLELRRRDSRKIRPQPEQLWVQDGDLLYIDSVDDLGVELIHLAGPGKVLKWKDSWERWNERLRVRVVWYTGKRQPLRK